MIQSTLKQTDFIHDYIKINIELDTQKTSSVIKCLQWKEYKFLP